MRATVEDVEIRRDDGTSFGFGYYRGRVVAEIMSWSNDGSASFDLTPAEAHAVADWIKANVSTGASKS